MTDRGNLFNLDYYEHGVTTRTSGYENYKYMPTRSFEEAIELNKMFPQGTFLDVGCAKGYLVHSLRQLGREAFGEDISDYALYNSHPRVRNFVSKPTTKIYDNVICKDVPEHIPEADVPKFLSGIASRCYEALFVIPLGDNDKFRIREYEIDVTHVTKKDEDWWIDQMRDAGLELTDFSYTMGRMKEKWVPINYHGNGFFKVRAKHD
jgi:SAM-dependent methyltransferase